jgi:rfaE bifunctional protein nucleotidyltransferase chain/domain
MALVAKRLKAKDKIVTNVRTLAGILEGLRSQGKTIVFTTGCFDLLHPGHVRFLEDAKSRGDFLVVGVHDDRGCGRLKGKGFPVNDLDDRLECLAGFGSVDYVTPCEGEDAARLIELFAPAIFAKGQELQERSVHERAALKAKAVRVIACGDRKTHSLRKVVLKIRKRKFE